MQYRRFFDMMAAALAGGEAKQCVVAVHPKDLSWAKGVGNESIRALRARIERDIFLEADPKVPRGTIKVREK